MPVQVNKRAGLGQNDAWPTFLGPLARHHGQAPRTCRNVIASANFIAIYDTFPLICTALRNTFNYIIA